MLRGELPRMDLPSIQQEMLKEQPEEGGRAVIKDVEGTQKKKKLTSVANI